MHRKSVYLLLAAVGALIVIGCVMLFSTSAFALDHRGDPNYFIRRQFIWLGVGLVGMVAAATVDYHTWRKHWIWLFAGSLVLLILCFVPHVGMRINGSSRWLSLGFASFQPSELAKLTTIIAVATWFSRDDVDERSFWRGFVLPGCIAAMPLALIAPEVDMGATALIGATTFAMMFVAGVRMRILGPVVVGIWMVGSYVATHIPERLGRLMAFRDLEKYRLGAGLQQYQALIAFGSGGAEGLGLGNSRQKLAYLPEAHTDFIFPVVGEELGLRITLLVVVCYLVIVLCGVLIAMNSRDRFGMLLGFGIVVLIALQASVNIGVTTALLPNKGLPLPFVSYGGSNLALCLLNIGILLNIYRQGITEKETVSSTTVLAARTRRKRRLAVRI